MLAALASIWFDRGQVPEARAALDEALRLLNRAEAPRALAMVEGSAAEVALREGDLERAEGFAQSVCDRNHASGVRNRFDGELVLAAVRLQTGREAEARVLVERIRRLAGADLAPSLAVLLDAVDACLADHADTWRVRVARVRATARGVTGVLDHLVTIGTERARARGWERG